MAKTARGEEVIESAMQKIANAVTVGQLTEYILIDLEDA